MHTYLVDSVQTTSGKLALTIFRSFSVYNMLIVLGFIPFSPLTQWKYLFISLITGLITVYSILAGCELMREKAVSCFLTIASQVSVMVPGTSWTLIKYLLIELKNRHSFIFLLNSSETRVRYIIFHCIYF